MTNAINSNESVNWWLTRGLMLILIIGLVAFSQGLVQGPDPARGNIAPPLRALAEAQPDAVISVIIQTENPALVTAAIERVGGEVTQDLHIINAIAARLPAGALAGLAKENAVRWISPDGPVVSTGKGGKDKSGGGGDPTGDPVNTYLDTLNVRDVWAMGYTGEGIGIAIIDSGVANDADFLVDPTAKVNQIEDRIRTRLIFGEGLNPNDETGHGTHVAGIAAGNGYRSEGAYAGVAPMADIYSLSVSNDTGMALESDTVAALQWVLDNMNAHNIRVVNLSLNSTVEVSYHASPLAAAAEILWFNGIVVVVSAGNSGNELGYNTIATPPANDPFLITVGATDEKGTDKRQDDDIADFTAMGWTQEYHWKPDLMAPGRNIVSTLASNSDWRSDYPDRVTSDGKYFRASGTSMAAPMVSGAVALLLQAEPDLNPDQVKGRLTQAAGVIQGNPYLDIHLALTWTNTGSANTGLQASQLLWTGSEPLTWSSVNWNSVNWNSVNWNSVNWNSVNWNSVNWND